MKDIDYTFLFIISSFIIVFFTCFIPFKREYTYIEDFYLHKNNHMIVAIYEDEVATSKDISLYNSDNIEVCLLKQQPLIELYTSRYIYFITENRKCE